MDESKTEDFLKNCQILTMVALSPPSPRKMSHEMYSLCLPPTRKMHNIKIENNWSFSFYEVKNVQLYIHDTRHTKTDDDGRKPIAMGLLSDSGDIKLSGKVILHDICVLIHRISIHKKISLKI